MLLKIICCFVLVVLAAVLGYKDNSDHDITRQEYRDEDNYDGFSGYQQANNEDFDTIKVKRFEKEPKIQTLSPLEIQGAIQQILSGYNQNNPFTPLPSVQTSNEKRSIQGNRVIHKARNAQPPLDNYFFNVGTQFDSYNDAIENNKLEDEMFTTTEALTTDDRVLEASALAHTEGASALTHDENYDTELNSYVYTTNSILTVPINPGTDTAVKSDTTVNFDTKNFEMDEIVTDDVTKERTVTDDYETETNIAFTTVNILHIATLPLPTDTDNIKSEVNRFLSGDKKYQNMVISNRAEADVETENVLVIGTAMSNKSDDNENEPTDMTEMLNVDEKKVENAYGLVSATTMPIRDEKEVEHENVNEADIMTTALPTRSHQPNRQGDEYLADNDKNITDTKMSNKTLTAKLITMFAQMETTQTYYKEPTTKLAVSYLPKNQTVVECIPVTTTKKTTTKRTTTTTTTRLKLDVPALLAIIANLTYDYEMNLTDNLNATLLRYSIPTCETPTTTEKTNDLLDYEANATGIIVAKCFVCGLEVEEIPRNAQCADAFAGDFLPLVPVDMTARGKISKFRKYCRYADIPHYMKNESLPRSVFGRWTGGCSVRWIDLSGVYTQRSCRNRERAILGRHFASKRMAKLEMALSNVDNGCISSPMATLVPLSRGISLYARFHACVCTGSWCNSGHIRIPWTSGALLTMLLPYIYVTCCAKNMVHNL